MTEHPASNPPLSHAGADLFRKRVIQWEDRTSWPLFVGAVVMLGATTWGVAVENSPPVARGLAVLAAVLLWGWFIADYVVRLILAGRERAWFVRSRAFDLITIALPFLRPLLIVVYVWRLPVFRYGGSARQRARYLVALTLFSLLFVYLASWVVWLVERDAAGASIVSFDDALFWGFTTITTVGYGNLVPITPLGRVLAVALMISGIAVIGVVSATVVSALNEHVRRATGIDSVGVPLDGKDHAGDGHRA